MIFVYSYNSIIKLYLILCKITRKEIFYLPKYKNKKTINYIHSKYFTETIKESRERVFEYFNLFRKDFNEDKNNIFNYINKYYDLNFTTFYVFTKSILFNDFSVTRKNLISDYVLKNIYFNKKNFSFYEKFILFFSFNLSFINFFSFFLKSFSICFFTSIKNKIDHPKLVYLRKKNYPDYVFLTLKKYLNDQNINTECIIINFSIYKSSNNFKYLNNLKYSSFLSIKSFLYTLIEFFKYFLFLKK